MMILVCLVSFLFFTSVLGSSGSTIVTFQCQDATHPNLNTHFFPLATKDGGNSWFSAGDPFTSASLYFSLSSFVSSIERIFGFLILSFF